MQKCNWRPEAEMPRNGNTIRLHRGGHLVRFLPYKKRSAEFLAGVEGRWQVWLYDHWEKCRFEPKGQWRPDHLPVQTPVSSPCMERS